MYHRQKFLAKEVLQHKLIAIFKVLTNDESFNDKKYSALTTGLRITGLKASIISKYWKFLILIRWLVKISILIFLRDNPVQ
jgi:hypothetical protein